MEAQKSQVIQDGCLQSRPLPPPLPPRQVAHSTCQRTSQRNAGSGGGGRTPSCLGEVRPHRGCCGSLPVSTVPGAPMLTPVQCCRIDSFCSVSKRKVRAHQPGSLSKQRWEVRPGWSKRLHPQAQRCSAGASWYLELSRDGFDDSG